MKNTNLQFFCSLFSNVGNVGRLSIAASAIAISLTACADRTLDYRNGQIVNGKIYAADANTPFSGKVTNVPFSVVFNSQQGMDLIIAALQTGHDLNLYGTICDAKLNAGKLDGDVTCRTARSDTVRLKTSFSDSTLSGGMAIYSTDGRVVIVSAQFKHGRPDGQEKQVLASTEKTIRTVHWDDGRLDGETKVWNPQTGDLTYAANYRLGILNGDFYSQSGLPGQEPFVTKGSYENGKFTGTKPASFPNDQYKYDIRVDAKYSDDVIQNQDDIDRMNRFGHEVVDCVHRTAYSIAKKKGRSYLETDEEKQLVVQCKGRVASAGDSNKDNDGSVLEGVAGDSEAATTYLKSVSTGQNGQDVSARANTVNAESQTPAPDQAPASSSSQPTREKRCGWIENSLPGGELTLQDRDGTWGISSAAGIAKGLDKMPATNKGDSCGCLSVTTDSGSKRITQVFGGQIIANNVCQADSRLN